MEMMIGSGRRGYADGDAKTAAMHRPYGVCALRGGRDRLRLAFTDTHNNALRLVQEHESTDEASQYRVSTVESAGLLTPKGLCATEDGRYVFLCDTGHHKIKFAALPAQSGLCDEELAVDGIEVFAFAGNGKKGWQDGPVQLAAFNTPCGICEYHDGTIIVADTGNHCIRQIRRAPKSGALMVTTIAGGYASQKDMQSKQTSSNRAGYRDGRTALFRSPSAVVEGWYHDILVADTMNNCIRALKLSTDGLTWETSTVCGNPQSGYADGSCAVSRFSQPIALCRGPQRTIFVSDRENRCIRQIGSMSNLMGYSWVRTIDHEIESPFYLRDPSIESACVLGMSYIPSIVDEGEISTGILVACDSTRNIIQLTKIRREDQHRPDGNQYHPVRRNRPHYPTDHASEVLKQRDRDNWSQVDTRSIISLETESTTGTAESFAGPPLKLEENGADESIISNPCQLCGMMLPFDQDAMMREINALRLENTQLRQLLTRTFQEIERVGESLHD